MKEENITNTVGDAGYFFKSCIIYTDGNHGEGFEGKFATLEEAKKWVEMIYNTKKVSFQKDNNCIYSDNNFCHFFGGPANRVEWKFKTESKVWEKLRYNNELDSWFEIEEDED